MTSILARVRSSLIQFEHHPGIQYLSLALITLVAAGLRFYHLGEWSFWIDEIYTIGHAQAHFSSFKAILRNIPPSRNWIPLSVMFTAGTLNVLGTSEWSARLVSAVVGVVSIPVMYFPVKRLFGPAVGLLAALLLTVSPWHLYWSQNARFYTSLMVLYSWALFAFFLGLERDRTRYLILSIVLLYLATSERLFALFMVPVMLCYVLIVKIGPFEKPAGLRARNLWLLTLPAIAFGIFEIYSLLTTGSSITVFTLDVFAGRVNHSPFRLLASIVYRIGLPWICLGIAGGLVLLVQRKRVGVLLSAAAWLPPLALLLMAPFTITIDRYVFMSLPFWIILAAVALHELFVRVDKVGKVLAVGVLLLAVAVPLSEDLLYFEYQRGNRPDSRAAFTFVEQQMAEDDLVMASRLELGQYYLGEVVREISSMDPVAVEQAGNRVWFVIDDVNGVVAPDLREWILEHSELIRVFELSLPGKSMSIYVYLYDPMRASFSAASPNCLLQLYVDAVAGT